MQRTVGPMALVVVAAAVAVLGLFVVEEHYGWRLWFDDGYRRTKERREGPLIARVSSWPTTRYLPAYNVKLPSSL